MSSIAFNSFTPSNVAQMTATARTGPAPDAPAPDQDKVAPTASAQAEAMHQGGESVSAIAASLGTSVQIVDTYLSITPTAVVPDVAAPAVHAAHAAPVPQAAPATPTAPSGSGKV